jgi:hypothetical protein
MALRRIVNQGSTEMDEGLADFHRRNESWRLLSLSATESELKEALQTVLNAELECVITVAKHCHGRGDHGGLHRAIRAFTMNDPAVSERADELLKTAIAIKLQIAIIKDGKS